MDKLNIWNLQIAETLPFDKGTRKMRTALLSEELARRGHNVVWWTSAFDHNTKSWQAHDGESRTLADGVEVRFIRGLGYRTNFSLKRFLDHRVVARKFYRRAAKLPPPDLIIAAMPSYDLSYRAALLAGKWKIPLIIDLRDQWPDLFVKHLPAPLRQALLALLGYDRYMLRYQCRKAASLVSMTEGILRWGQNLSARKNLEDDRVFLIGAPRAPEEQQPNVFNIPPGKFVVSFVGTFGTYSSPEVLLRAARRLRGEKDVLFMLGGTGNYFEELKRQAADLDNVRLPGWLQHEQIWSLLQRSHAGVVSGTGQNEAFPNKAFVYLSMGLPLLCDTEGDLKRLVESEKAGLYFPANDDAALAERILRLKNNPQLRAEMAGNSKKVFLERLNADKIYRDYADHVEQIAAKAHKRRESQNTP